MDCTTAKHCPLSWKTLFSQEETESKDHASDREVTAKAVQFITFNPFVPYNEGKSDGSEELGFPQ